MKVEITFLANKLSESGASEVAPSATVVFKTMYTAEGFEAFRRMAGSMSGGQGGIGEDGFVQFMREATDLSDWEILDLFDAFDRRGEGVVLVSDLFLLVAILVASESKQSKLVLFLHGRDLFEILSRRSAPPDIAADALLAALDGQEPPPEEDVGPVSLASVASGRRSSSSSLSSSGTLIEGAGDVPAVMNFQQFCGLGAAVGLTPSSVLSVLEEFGVRPGDSMTFDEFMTFAHVVLSTLDSRHDAICSSSSDDTSASGNPSQRSLKSQISSRCCTIS